MKRSLSPMTVSLTLLTILAVAAAGCKKSVTTPAPPPPPSIQSQLIGKWTMVSGIGDYLNYGMDSKDTVYFTAADYFDFEADSTLSVMQGGVAYNGRWEVDSSRLFIVVTNYMDSPGGYDLPVLDQHNLTIHNSDTATNSITDQKVNLTR